MRQIVGKSKYYFYLEGVDRRPIPPGKWVNLSMAEFVIRLRSTRRGRAAWWKMGEGVPREALSRAHFEPLLRAFISGIEWYPPGHYRQEEYVAPGEIRQGGGEVLNFTAKIEEAITDSLFDAFTQVAALYPPEELIRRQGSLVLYSVSCPPCGEEEIPRARPHRWFYNHLLCGLVRFAWRVVEGEGIGVALFENGGVVLSPDHNEPISHLEGWCVLRHPLPRKGVVD